MSGLNSELGLLVISSTTFGEVSLVGSGVLGEPLFDVFNFTAVAVIDSSLVVGGVELEGGVSLDLNSFDLVEGSIEISHDDVGSLDVLTELNPLGGNGLAVTAPGGVVLDEDILGGVLDNSLEVLSDELDDGAVVLLGDILRLSVGNELAIFEVLVELVDVGLSEVSDLTFPDVFLEVGLRGDESEGGEISLGDSNEFSKSLLDSSSDTGVRHEDLTLEATGSLGESSLVLGVLLVGEEDDSGVSLGEDGLNVVFSELEESGDGVSSHPSGESSSVPFSRVDNVGLVEGTLDGDTVGSSSDLVSALSSGVPENEFLVGTVLSSSDEGIVVGSGFLSVVDSVQLASGLSFKIGTGDLLGRVAGLLGDPVDNGIGSTATSVLGVLAVDKPLKRWESLDVESLA